MLLCAEICIDWADQLRRTPVLRVELNIRTYRVSEEARSSKHKEVRPEEWLESAFVSQISK